MTGYLPVMPAGGTPPNPWKPTIDGGELVIYQDPELHRGEQLPCDVEGRQVTYDSADFAGVIVHPDAALALWKLRG